MPEPGKDVFADKPREEAVRNSAVVPPPVVPEVKDDAVKEPAEEKVVSSVGLSGGEATGVTGSGEEGKAVTAKEEVKVVEKVGAEKEAVGTAVDVKVGEVAPKAEEKKVEEAPAKNDVVSESESPVQSSSSTTTTETGSDTPVYKKPAGPLDEVDMEAVKVAEELYPEAAGQA